MVPVFYLEMTDNGDDEVEDIGDKKKKSKEKNKVSSKIKRIGAQMTSVFVTIPIAKTVITFSDENRDGKLVLEIDGQHRTSLADCWSRVQDELKKSYSKLRQYDGQYLAYSLLDQAVDMIGPVISKLRKAIHLEKTELPKQQYKNMDYIHLLGNELKRMRNKLKPFMRLLVHVIEDDTILPGP
jgi:Mg2+ and Co2+ transporter CorA